MSARRGLIAGLAVALVAPAAHAELRPLNQTEAPGPASRYTTESAEAQIAGDNAKALSLAEKAIKVDPKDPWGYYDRADALRGLRRTEEAVAAFREAEGYFATADIWGKSVAIWGEANAFSREGRCQEAAPVFERYAAFVEKVDADAAALAHQYGKHCVPRAQVSGPAH